jgi:hypothetical protein
VRADLDTLVIALYCAACSLFPADPRPRRGRPQTITDNELLCLMVAQMLLGQPSDRRFLALARWRLGQLFPKLPSQSRYNERCRQLAPKLVTLWRAIAYELPGFHDAICLIDTTPLPCGQSVQTVNRSELAPWCGFGYSAAHSRFYWGMKLVLVCGPDGCVRDFDLVPANAPEREVTLNLLARQPIAGQPIGFIRQRIESIVNSFKDQLRLEHHLAKTPDGLWTRIAARVLALCAAIHLNWQLGTPRRALTPYGH